MTQLPKRSQTRTSAAQSRKLSKRVAEGLDQGDVFDATRFAQRHFSASMTKAWTVKESESIGLLALSLAGWVLKSARVMQTEKSNETPMQKGKKAPVNETLLGIFKETLPLKLANLEGALKELSRIAPHFETLVRATAGEKAMDEHSDGIFSAATLAYRLGCDGHPFSRETAMRLRLTRYFEKTSSEFARFLSQAYAVLAKNGTAYLAWTSNFPVFICDLNEVNHQRCANLLVEQCHGEVVMITPTLKARSHMKLASKMLVVDDESGIFRAMAGDFAPAMLLERRLGGWTVTYPCGHVSESELKKASHPALARALALCAEHPFLEKKVKKSKVHVPRKRDESSEDESLKAPSESSMVAP